MTSTDEQDAPPGPATFDDPDADDDRPGREVTDFVARLRDGFPPKVAATDGCMIATTYALVDGDQGTDQLWSATHESHGDIALPVEAAVAVAEIGRDYNGRGTEPNDGRTMTVRDDAPLFIEGPRDPVEIAEARNGQHYARCVICPDRGAVNMLTDGSATVAPDPGSARSELASHLRRQHDRSPWPGQR